MKKPFKFTVICNKTGSISETDITPVMGDLQTWELTADSKVRELRQTKTVYIDIRYQAKLRLWKYVNYTRVGKKIPKYKPQNVILPF